VFSVKSYVQSILLNLVSNAVKYRSPERPLRIQIETRREESLRSPGSHRQRARH
jgi:signal transduction histidine kinase